jgi:serine/threonine protein kinase
MSTIQRTHGRHGDLKPENILWFKNYKDNDHNSFMGVLKISDFGLTRFHKTASTSRTDPFGISPTYRAPEYDVRKKVSQSYDVWSLGCVILEFITWYILGSEEVQAFEHHRVEDDNSIVKEDVFFNHVKKTGSDGQTKYGARFKLSVANVSVIFPPQQQFHMMLKTLVTGISELKEPKGILRLHVRSA